MFRESQGGMVAEGIQVTLGLKDGHFGIQKNRQGKGIPG